MFPLPAYSNDVVNFKTVIVLILGLLFQLAQVPSGGTVTVPCFAQAGTCDCCSDPGSCDCAESGEPGDHTPFPAVPDTGRTLKTTAFESPETRISPESARETEASTAAAAVPIRAGPLLGYTGVRLSVAFCRIVM